MATFVKRLAALAAALFCLSLPLHDQGDPRPWLSALAQGGCTSNPIVCENQLPGDADYDVSAAGDPTIEGFAADISVNRGDTVQFKIRTEATSYNIAIYRLGFYGGLGARKITTLGPFHQQELQPDCLADTENTGIVDCGNWRVTASWDTDGATSGIYLAKLNRLDITPGGSSHIVFVVRDDTRAADMLFQTSDTTWQAYNLWGGANLYCGGPISNAGTGYGCDGRAVKVSYNRPFDTRAHDPQSFLFNAEYPMLRWLEANGYDVKYWSGVDTDRLGAQLTGAHRPKTFISVGHDEYWSGDQRAKVELARNAGVNLAFFSGNEIYWKTRWEAGGGAAAVPYRTLVTYKETLRNTINNAPPDPLNSGPNPISTATWRDTRFGAPADGGRPENALIGTIWTVNCCSSAITVPASMKGLRFWRNTRVADLADGSVAVLSPESLGYEWDEDLDNGFRPAGLVRLSTTTREVPEKILDFGTRVGPGTATHSLTLYKHQSGALVFGAGTVQWAWGLDGIHDRGDGPGSHTPDPAMQQATVNLFADMNMQPGTVQPGLVTAARTEDIAAPVSTIVSPAGGSTVHSGGRVMIAGTAIDQTGVVAGVEVSVDGGSTWRPAQGTGNWTFEWSVGNVGLTTLRVRAIDDSGNLEVAGPGIIVSVEPGTCPCTSLFPNSPVPLVGDYPDDTALELGVKFRSDIAGFITGVRYYKSAANSGTHVGNLWTTTGVRLATATFTGESAVGWQQVLFDAPVPISANTVYIASYHTDRGHYAASAGYFANSGVDSAPLHALSSTEGGGNGVYFVGGSFFPSQSFNSTNYWVDVVFSSTSTDTTPPVISGVRQTTIDGSNAAIEWNTSEDATSRVEYSTDVMFPGAATLSATGSGFSTAHRLVLSHLVPNTTYFYRVTSVDRTGNAATAVAPSFTLPGPTLRDTARVDFAAGSGTSTYASQTGDGELILAPAAGSEFSGPGLPQGWLAVPWNTGGSAIIRDGTLVVDGSRVGTCTPDTTGTCRLETGSAGPGRSLEFVAQFGSDGFQHAGFGLTLGDLAEPWAIFSTSSGDGVYARTNTGVVSVDQPLGAGYLTGPHRYRIDWHTDGTFTYFIDGAQVARHTATITGLMRPVAASDFSLNPGVAVVDWMRMTPYAATGSFNSRVFDAEATVTWNTIQWLATTPPGTAVAISVRTGDTPVPDAAWTSFAPMAGPGPLASQSRYIQYRADLASSSPEVTPSLDDIIISTSRAPTAQNDQATVLENSSFVFAASGPGSLTFNDVDLDPPVDLRVISVTQPAHGATVLAADGSVTYAPAANYRGPDSFAYVVSDGLLTASAMVAVTVRDGNMAPVATPDGFAMAEDTTLVVGAAAGLLANDADADNDQLSAVLVAPPAHGTLSLDGSGAFTYTPQPNYAGSDVFQYKAYDGTVFGNVTAVAITIGQVNDGPLTVADGFMVMMNQPLLVAAPGVLANDRDVEVEDVAPLRALPVELPSHGTLTLQENGSFVYEPQANFVGVDRFKYAAVDHFGTAGNTVTVTLNVQIEAVTGQLAAAGTVSTGSEVTAGDPLQTAITTPSAATVIITHGVISNTSLMGDFTFLNRQANITVLNADGTEFSGTTAVPLTLAFMIDASLVPSGTSAATLQIFRNAVNIPDCLGLSQIPSAQMDPCITRRDPGPNGSVLIALLTTHASEWNLGLASTDAAPIARNDSAYFTTLGTPMVVPGPGVLGNDLGRAALTAAVLPDVHGGTVTLSAGGGFVFTPEPGFCGPAGFTYRASDGTLTSNTGAATVHVNCDPIAVADTFTVREDSTSALTVLANDADVEGHTRRVTSVTPGPHGSVTIGTDGAWVTYAPSPDFFGQDTFSYTITDERGGRATGSVTVTVDPVNDVPSFTKGSNQAVLEDPGAKSIAAWATSLDPGAANENGQALTFIVSNDNNGLFSAQPAVAADGTLTYTPAPNANGSATVTVRIHDNGGIAGGGVDTGAALTFVITVTAINDAPSFTKGPDQSSVAGAGAQTVAAWATGVSAGPPDEAAVQTMTFTVTNNNNTLFAVQPAIAPNGTLTYTPKSTGGGSAQVTVTLKDTGGVANGGVDTSAAATFNVVLPYTTTTALTSPTASPTTFGQNVVLNATVSSPGGGTPLGSVDFLDNGALLGNVILVNGSASLTTGAIGSGAARTVKAVYKPAAGFLASEMSITRAVNAAATSTTLTATTGQYSDVSTFQTTVTGSPAGAPAGSATFKVGTMVVGTAPLLWDGALYRATLATPLLEPTYTPGTGGLGGNGALKPAAKTISVVYNTVSPNYTLANRSGSMTVTREDALVAYTGSTSVNCSSCSAVPVQLRAAVSETDAAGGDLRNAIVAFVNRTTGATIATVPVAADGTASYTWTVNLGAATIQTTKIGMIVSGYYIRSNTADDGTVTIRKQ